MDDLTRARLISLGLIHPKARELPSQLSALSANKLERLLQSGSVALRLRLNLPESLWPYLCGAEEVPPRGCRI